MPSARSIPGTGPLVESKLSTTPTISTRSDLDSSEALPPGLALEEAGPPGDFSVEGIKITVGEETGTGPVSEASRVVSIIADASRDDIKRAIEEKTRGPQPVILSFQKLPGITPTDIDAVIETSQFERQIITEAIVGGYDKVKGQYLQSEAKAAVEEAQNELKNADEKISAISYMLDKMETAASGLNISQLSAQIMQKASDALAEITVQTEATSPRLPSDLDEYISLTFRNQNASISGGVDRYLTNTSRMVVLAQDMLLACLTAHPITLSKFSRGDLSSLSNIFSVPGAYGYNADGPAAGSSAPVSVPTISELFARNSRTITSQFIIPSSTGGRAREDIVFDRSFRKGAITKSFTRPNPGFLSTTVSTAATQDEMWDDILHSICALSNELVTSAGVGRLLGSNLGNRYLTAPPTPSATGKSLVEPFERIFGFSPTASSSEISRFFTTGPAFAGSFLDYLALGEENTEGRDVIVMPFESDTALYNNTYYVSGRRYFIDLALAPERKVLRGALSNFSSKYSTLMNDMSAYLTELMALDSTTSLAPELLMSRILQDFQGVLSSFSEGSIDNEKSALVAALFTISGFSDQQFPVQFEASNNSGTKILTCTCADVIKMSVIKALQDFDALTDDIDYTLERPQSDYLREPISGDTEFITNPIQNLKSAINGIGSLNGLLTRNRADIISSLRSPDRASVSRTFFYYYDKTNETNFLHDGTFASRTNLVNLVARTVREIQKEALNLAQRSGSKSDYRNSAGGTYMSNCDEDRLIDVVCTIYTNLAYLLLPISLVKESDTVATGTASDSWKLGMVYNQDAAKRGAAITTDIIESLVNGASITAAEVFNRTLLDPETQISLSPTGGDNTEATTVASLIDMASRLPKHRYYIKSSLKILEATAAAVSSADAVMSELFSVLNATVEKKRLKGPDAKLYDLFVTDLETNSDLLRNMSESQINLCVPARRIFGSPDSSFLRRDLSTSTAERLALRDYVKSIYELQGLDDLHIASVGLPRGLMDSIYYDFLSVGTSSALASLGSERRTSGRTLKIELDRYDNAYINARSSVHENVYAGSHETEFDPEIFVLSDSITYDPKNKPSEASNVFDAIFLSTKFYRIRRGKVAESFTGLEATPSVGSFCKNALRSYLLDLYLYETAGFRYCDGAVPYGAPRLSQSGYQLIKSASGNESASLGLINKAGFEVIFDGPTRRVKTGPALRSLVTPIAPGRSAQCSEQDIKFASLLACVVPLCDATDIVRLRPYERVFHFLYDEAIVRNNISGDTAGTGDGVISNAKSNRAQFDIFSISARAVRGTV